MAKRRLYLINKRFQSRFALELAAIVLLVPVAIWVNYFMIAQYVLVDKGALSQYGDGWQTLLVLLQQQSGTMLGLYVVSVVITGVCLLLYAHRVAGPIYRFDKILLDFVRGKFDATIQLRKRDYFEDVAHSIVNTGQTLGRSVEELKQTASGLAAMAKDINDPLLADRVKAIENILQRYR